MEEKNATLTLTSLILGSMALITVFGGYTVFLGMIFAFIGILTGIRGRRQRDTAVATWAIRISVFGLILCTIVFLFFLVLYFTSMVDIPFDFFGIYDYGKELIVRIIRHF